MKIKALLLFLAAGSITLAVGTEYFVSNSGNNANTGDAENPFLTIQYAVNKAKPGDIVTVRSGVYREQVKVKNSGLPGKPITLRGAKGETALLTAGFAVTQPWSRNARYKNIWESFSPYSINMLWESKRAARYLEVKDMAWLSRQPGAFLLDKKSGKLYINTFGGESPNELGIVVVPYYTGKSKAQFFNGSTGNVPAPYSHNPQGVYRLNKGIFVSGSHIILENLYLNWWPGQAIRVNAPAHDCIVRNVNILGGTCGIMQYGPVYNLQVTDNYVRRVSGIGILFGDSCKHVLSARNTIINCGTCPPFKDDISGSQGHVYSMAFYGGKPEYLDFVDNTIISNDPVRNNGWRIVRCKGGIHKHTLQSGNVLWGGGVDLYAAPDKSKATIKNNTIWGGCGTYNVGRLTTGEPYTPDFKDNLFLRSGSKDPGFADPSYYDFRLRPDSKALGKGAFPVPGQVLYVAPDKDGDGSTPAFAFSSLAKALKKAASGNYTVYIAPGIYTGKADFRGDKLTIRALGKGIVTLHQFKLNLSGSVTIEDLIFDVRGSIVSSGRLELRRCAVNDTSVRAKELCFEESTLAGRGDLRASYLSLRNNLFVGSAVDFDSQAKIFSENNVFTASSRLATFQKHVKEAHPSFHFPIKVDRFFRIPANCSLTSAGLSAQCIGGRPVPEAVREFTVEGPKATAIANDTLRLEWNTPLDYCEVSIRGNEFGTRPAKYIPSFYVHQGELQHTGGLHYVRNLTPGKTYALQFYFYRRGVKKPYRRDLKVLVPTTFEHKPVILTVSKDGSGKYSSIGAALLEARKGDTILVKPGTYTERLQISADNLTLKSTVPGGARLNADGLLNCTLAVGDAKNCTLDGFFFVGNRYSASAQALSASGAKKLTIRNCRFDRKRPRGCANVHFYGHSIDGLLMENCVFDAGFHGVWTLNSDKMIFRNNTFYGQGINGIHAGIRKGGKAEIYNNIFMDTVSNHTSPAVSVSFVEGISCDYNLYWKARTNQLCFGFGCHKNGVWSAPWSVMRKDMEPTVKAANKRFGVEAHGIEADPLFVDAPNADFNLKPESPALNQGRDGKNIGADFSIFAK